jgi:hypothetical protein
MDNGYVFLIEKEEMWARMLIEVLEDNNVPCVALPVYGAGFTIKTGIQDILRVFVPSEYMTQATELVEELFSPGNIVDD